MFFPDQVATITTPEDDSEGFFYFNPDENIETAFDQEDPVQSDLKKMFNTQMNQFALLNLILVFINVVMIIYWLTGLSTISVESQESSFASQTSANIITYFIMSLMIVHFIWIVNFLLGYNFLKYEFTSGVIFYFVILNLIFFVRITINLFIIITESTIELYMGSNFNVAIYILAVIVQTAGDILLTLLAARIKKTTVNLAEIGYKRLTRSDMQRGEVYRSDIPDTEKYAMDEDFKL